MVLMAAKKHAWGRRLKKLRKATGLTQIEVAETLAIPLTTLRNWEQGRVEPPTYVRLLVERALEERSR